MKESKIGSGRDRKYSGDIDPLWLTWEVVTENGNGQT